MLTEFLSFAVLAGGTNENAFANSRYATLSRPAVVRYYMVQDGATTQPDAQVEITHGNVIIRTLSPIQVAGVGLGPNVLEVAPVQAGADINDRIVIRATNGGGLTANFRILVEIDLR